MINLIKPTVGRVVWYHPASLQPGAVRLYNAAAMLANYGDQPMAATVAYVWGDRLVNLVVTDHAGVQHACPSVPLVQEGDRAVPHPYCEWMPYQKGQAAKTDAAEATALELGAAVRAAGMAGA